MKKISFIILISLTNLSHASFPIQTTTACDTIIESKKETMEEYKIRIQKQLKLTNETKNDTIEDSSFKFQKRRFLQNWNWKNALTIVFLLIVAVILIVEIYFHFYFKNNFEL